MISRARAATVLCVCAGLAWPAAVNAHGDRTHGLSAPPHIGGPPVEAAATALSQQHTTAPPPTVASPLAAVHHGDAPQHAAPQSGGLTHHGEGGGHSGASPAASTSAHELALTHSGDRESTGEIGHSPKEAQTGAENGNRETGRPVSSSHSGSGSGSGSGDSGSTPPSPPAVTMPKTELTVAAPHSGSGSATPAAASSGGGSNPASSSSPASSTPSQATGSSPGTGTSAPTPTVTGSAPEHATHGAGAHHHRGDHHGRVRATRTSAGPLATGARVRGAVAAPATGTGTHGTPAGGSANRAHRVHRASVSGLTPAIQTVERIVDVVPRGIWAVIALLGALAGLLAGGSWLTTSRARRLERQRGYLAEEVGLLQAALLPEIPERFGPVVASVAYRPAEGPAAGGDFYDLFALEDGRIAVIVGDISGHGPTALPQTALIRYTLRTYLDAGLIPRAALHAAAVTLDHQLDGSFATVVLAIYDPAERTLTYACAGHPPPVVLTPDPVEAVVAGAAPPIGAGMPTGTRQTVLRLPPGSGVCFFTDGIVEARTRGELYGAERLTEALAALGAGATAKDLLDHVVAATDRRPDDMAAALLHLDGSPAPETRAGSNGHATSAEQSESSRVVRSEELELDRAALAGERVQRFLAACGLPEARIAEAVRAARVVVESAGEAVLRLRFDGGPVEVEVVPHNTGVLHLAKHPESSKEAQLASGR